MSEFTEENVATKEVVQEVQETKEVQMEIVQPEQEGEKPPVRTAAELPKKFYWEPTADVNIKGVELSILNDFINNICLKEVKFSLLELYTQDKKIVLAGQCSEVIKNIFIRMQDLGQITEDKSK